jgi:hypothetical protein
VRTGATFADAAAEWLRYVEHDRDVKPSTLTDYRSVVARLVPEFGSLAIEEITLSTSSSGVPGSARTADGRCRTGRATSH